MSERKEKLMNMLLTLLSIILSFFLLFVSFFVIYANEMIPEKNSKTEIEKNIFYNEIFLWDYLKKTEDYKNSIMETQWEWWTKWIIRLFWIFCFWFALTLFFIPTFPNEEKDKLSVKAFILSVIVIPIFIILLKIYLFVLAWGFKFDFSFLTSKETWNLSILDKVFIIFVIIFIFIVIWYLYYYQKNKQK